MRCVSGVWITLVLAAWTAAAAAVAAEKPAAKIVVAVVGAAHSHLKNFTPRVLKRPDVTVKYVWDHDTARARLAAGPLGAKVPDDLQQIWSDPEVAGVFIFSETIFHHDLVLAAVRAGKPMFVEKPLGMNAKECEEMADAVTRSGLIFTTGYFFRTLPVNLFLKDEIAKGNLGTITRARSSYSQDTSLTGWLKGTPYVWAADVKLAGVGAFGNMGSHSVDLLMWMLGDIVSVTAELRPVVRCYNADMDETGEALVRFKSGAIGTVAAGWADLDNPVTLLISGTQGHAAVMRGKLYYKSKKVPGADGKKPWTDLPPPQPEPTEMFLDALGGKKGLPLVTAREAATRVRVMDAVYAAARRHVWVSVGGGQ